MVSGIEGGDRIPATLVRHSVESTELFDCGTGKFTGAPAYRCGRDDGQRRERAVGWRAIPFSTAHAASRVREVKPSFASALAT